MGYNFHVNDLDFFQWYLILNPLNYPPLNMTNYHLWKKHIPTYKEIKKKIKTLTFSDCYKKEIPSNMMTFPINSTMYLKAQKCFDNTRTKLHWFPDFPTTWDPRTPNQLYYQQDKSIFMPWKTSSLSSKSSYHATQNNYYSSFVALLAVFSGFILLLTTFYCTPQKYKFQNRKNSASNFSKTTKLISHV